MAKQLTVTHDGKSYTLEYTRRSIAALEGDGVDFSTSDKKPVDTTFKAFKGAFFKHHKDVYDDEDLLWDIFEEQDLSGLSADLGEMITDVANSTSKKGERKRTRNW